MVLVTTKLVSPLGKLGCVKSNGQSKTSVKVRSGISLIVVSAAPEIVNDVGNPVYPDRFSAVHVAGRVGNDVNPVSPVRLTVVSLVLFRFKVVSPVGKVGSVVSDGQPDKFKVKVLDGNPAILVSPAPEIINVLGRPLHPARLSDVTPAGISGKDDSDEQFVRFIDLADGGNPLPTVNKLVHPVRSMVANLAALLKYT